jgi:plastocyanin
MENTKNQDTKKKMLPFIGVGVLILVIVVIVLLSRGGKQEAPTDLGQATPETGAEQTASETATGTPEAMTPTSTTPINPVLVDAKREAPGTNLITTKGQVVTETGAPVLNNVTPMAPQAPQQTAPIAKGQVSGNAIKIDISASGYAPNSFTVNKGQAVTIALSSTDSFSHMLKFEDAGLSAVGTAVSAGETRAITFNAPTTAGEYKFFCDIPGHVSRGETGKMIVK